MFMKPNFDNVHMLHARMGHLSSLTIMSAIASRIGNETTVRLVDVANHLSLGLGFSWAQANMRKPALHAQDQSWMEGQVSSFGVVCSDII